MNDYYKRKKSEMEDELLEIFILIEKNTFQDSKEAVIRYQRMTGQNSFSMSFSEIRRKYKEYIEKQ